MLRKVLALTWVAALASATAAVPAFASASDEAGFVSHINSARAGAGMAPLEVYWDLSDDARQHTGDMIAAGEIFHSANLGGVTSGWWMLGENVGVGGDVAGLHAAFMDSSPHRANILNGDFNYVGVGADRADNGYLYVTVIFMQGPEGLVSPPEEDPAPDPPAEPPPASPEPAPEESVSEADPEPPETPSPPEPAPQPAAAPRRVVPAEPQPVGPGPEVLELIEAARQAAWAPAGTLSLV